MNISIRDMSTATSPAVQIEAESADKLYAHIIAWPNGLDCARTDKKYINGREYHYTGRNTYADRVFDSLHSFWIANEKDVRSMLLGDRDAFWRLREAATNEKI